MQAETVSGETWADEADAPPPWGEWSPGTGSFWGDGLTGASKPNGGEYWMKASGANVVPAEAGFERCCGANQSADNTDCLTAHNA